MVVKYHSNIIKKRVIMVCNSEVILIGGSSSLCMAKKVYARRNKANARVLVIPTASGDNPDIVTEISGYLDEMQVDYSFLLLCTEEYTDVQIEKKVMSADIIYMPGGEEERMKREFSARGIDKMFLKLAKEGKTLFAGSSAGGMLLAEKSTFKYADSKEKMVFDGLGYAPVIFAPHYQMEEYKTFDECLKDLPEPEIAFAAGDDAGILCRPDGRFYTFFGGEGNPVWSFLPGENGERIRTEYPEGEDTEIKVK